MNAYEKVAGVGLDAGSSGESLLGVWRGRDNSPQIPNVLAARKLLADGLREQDEDERVHAYTPEGRKETRDRRWKPKLKALGAVFDKVRDVQIDEQRRAYSEGEAAVREVAPSYGTNSSLVHIDIELSRLMRLNDGHLRNFVVGMARDIGEVAPESRDVAAAIVRLPVALTGVSFDQQYIVRAALAGGDRLKVVITETADTRALIAHIARRMAHECGLNIVQIAALHRALGEFVSGRELGTPQPDAPSVKDAAAVSATVPLVTGDKVTDGYSEDAVA